MSLVMLIKTAASVAGLPSLPLLCPQIPHRNIRRGVLIFVHRIFDLPLVGIFK